MKKTAAVTINLRKFRPAFLCIAFLSVVTTSIFLSKTIPSITIGDDAARFFLSSNVALSDNNFLVSGAFSFNKVVSPEEIVSVEEVVASPTIENLSVPQKTDSIQKVEISDTTSSGVVPDDFLAPRPAFLDEEFSVLIIHTHTTESYTPSEKFSYIPSDTDRTTDKNYNMVRVGEEIRNVLESNGVKVYHDTTINDHPSYSGSYNKSAKLIQSHIKKDPSIKIVLDVHRDAIEGKNGEKIKYTTKIDGNDAAKIMLVAGSDKSGLSHTNWEENLKFATQLQEHTMSLYPDLCRPINFRSQRFNQQLAPAGIIVEVGTNGNTLDEAVLGAKCFAVALCDFIKK